MATASKRTKRDWNSFGMEVDAARGARLELPVRGREKFERGDKMYCIRVAWAKNKVSRVVEFKPTYLSPSSLSLCTRRMTRGEGVLERRRGSYPR